MKCYPSTTSFSPAASRLSVLIRLWGRVESPETGSQPLLIDEPKVKIGTSGSVLRLTPGQRKPQPAIDDSSNERSRRSGDSDGFGWTDLLSSEGAGSGYPHPEDTRGAQNVKPSLPFLGGAP